MRRSLDGEWRLDFFPQPADGAIRALPLGVDTECVTAQVPGNCELDLARAGRLPMPETGLNALEWRRYEGHQWLYTREFTAPTVPRDGSRALLRFEGIDTLADIFLNGEKIGETANMLVEHRFDVTRRLRAGTNTVQVLLRPPFLETQRHAVGQRTYHMGYADNAPFRKAAHMGGWDIFPRLYVAGLWRSVSLDIEPPVRIADPVWITYDYERAPGTASVQQQGKGARNRCRVRAQFRIEAPMAAFLNGNVMRLRIADAAGMAVASYERRLYTSQNSLEFEAAGFDLWWPAGAGAHPLYDASIEIVAPDGSVLARDVRRIGFRTIDFERDDDYGPERPGQFLFRINGEPIYIRGTNWVPTDAIPSRQAARIVPTLELAEEAHCNLVRVWGGGVYEPDVFYDWCDEHGMLVWQDFMTGCAQFPQDDAYAAATAAEVREVVLRLRNHAALLLWSGNNENDASLRWGRSAGPDQDPNDDRLSRVVIPQVLREFDPTRPYLPSSPYLSPDVAAGRAKPSEDHLWGARDWYKTPFYTEPTCRFVSESGWHGCPSPASLARMMTPECVYPWRDGPADSKRPTASESARGAFDWNDEWRLKASCPFLDPTSGLYHRNDLMTRQTARMFGEPSRDLAEFAAQSQTLQAEALKTMCELYRSRKFTRCNGLVWWNVRDGWPQISDAVVDWYGDRKAAFGAIRDAQRPVLALLLDDHAAWSVNDTLAPVSVRATYRTRHGATLLEGEWTVGANAALKVGEVPFDGQGVIDIEYAVDGGAPERNHYLHGEPPFRWSDVREWLG